MDHPVLLENHHDKFVDSFEETLLNSYRRQRKTTESKLYYEVVTIAGNTITVLTSKPDNSSPNSVCANGYLNSSVYTAICIMLGFALGMLAGYVHRNLDTIIPSTPAVHTSHQSATEVGKFHSLSARHDEELVRFYRYWKASVSDHFYTTNINEIGTAVKNKMGRHDYISEGIQCLLFIRQIKETIPLYRYWRPASSDHFYTTNAREIGPINPGMTGHHGYVSEGVAGYCFPQEVPGTIPLYRYWKESVSDHFYTTNAKEIGTIVAGQVGQHGYRSEGVTCYVIPFDG